MMLVTINNKILNLKIFCWLSILHQNQQNFKITVKMNPLQGLLHHPEAQYFIWNFDISSISYLSMVKKAKWFVIRKNSIFVNNKVENLKNLEILQSFSSGDNLWYICASKLKFSTYGLYWEYYRKIEHQTVIG